MIKLLRGHRIGLATALTALTLAISLAAPAMADPRHDDHRRYRRPPPRARVYAPPPVVYAPAQVYAAPPVVYAPPAIGLSINLR